MNVRQRTAVVVAGLFGFTLVGACRSDDAAEALPSSSSSGGTDGGVGQFECYDRCETKAETCGDGTSTCTEVCTGTVSEIVLDCVLALDCGADESLVSACLAEAPGSSSSGGVDPGPTGVADGGTCVAFGQNCAGTTCCPDTTHPNVSCNANNDGQGTSECCVASGFACQLVTDCCGYDAAEDDVKLLFSCNGGLCSTP